MRLGLTASVPTLEYRSLIREGLVERDPAHRVVGIVGVDRHVPGIGRVRGRGTSMTSHERPTFGPPSTITTSPSRRQLPELLDQRGHVGTAAGGERDGGRRSHVDRLDVGEGGEEIGIVTEDAAVEPLQAGIRIDAEVDEQDLPQILVHGQRLDLSARAVQRHHLMTAEALAPGLQADPELDVPQDVEVAAAAQVCLVALFDDPELELARGAANATSWNGNPATSASGSPDQHSSAASKLVAASAISPERMARLAAAKRDCASARSNSCGATSIR